MIRKRHCLVTAAMLLLVASPPAAAAEGVARLDWLAGCWRGEAGEECWLEPRGGAMLALNRGPDREGKAPAFELLRVIEDEEGLMLLAQPGGRSPATPFRAIEVGDTRVVFANPEHDFPQRITYQRDGDTLRARVEARQGGEWRGFEQVWSQAAWPRQAAQPKVLQDTGREPPREAAGGTDEALAAALERAAAEGWRRLVLVVECQRQGRLEKLRLWGSGVGTWQDTRQLRLRAEEVGEILDEIRRGGFAAMSPVYGGPPDSTPIPGETGQGARIVCRMVLDLDGQSKQVAQRKRGEQSAELQRLAGGILDRCRERGLAGVAADSLADGLAKLAAGTLAPEALRVAVQRKPEGRAEEEVGWLLNLTGTEARARTHRRSVGYGEEVVRRLGEADLQALVEALAAADVDDLPINLWAEQYTDVLVEILGQRKRVQARRFAGMEPTTHGEAQKRFDRLFDRLADLAAGTLGPEPDPAG